LSRQRVFIAVRVGLDHRVAIVGVALHADQELAGATIAEVGVEPVVIRTGDRQIFGVHPAAENLDAIVRAVVDLDVVDGGELADAAHGEALQLVAGRDHDTRIADLDEAQRTRIVVGLVAAIERGGGAFDDLLAVGGASCNLRVAIRNRGAAEQDDPAPQSLARIANGSGQLVVGGEDDRLAGAANRVQPRAAVHDQIGSPVGRNDDHARLDGEGHGLATGSGAVAADVAADVNRTVDLIDCAGKVLDHRVLREAGRHLEHAPTALHAAIDEAGRSRAGKRATRGRRRRRRRCRSRRGRSWHDDHAFPG
jgi:hypothetical protein